MSYGAPPGAYGQRPPSFGPPPGMDSTVPPPGLQSHSPAGMPHPSQPFQPPPNLPANINFNASVIRMGVPTPQDDRSGGRGSNSEPLGNRNRLGLGARDGGDRDRDGGRNLDRERAAVRESMMALQPPTREEVARTIFVGGLSEGVPGDEAIEGLLRCAGKLRRWTRARDAEDRKCKFGFAEYEDVESLEAANEIFAGGMEVPVFGKNGSAEVNEEGEVKMARLVVVVDEQSKSYISEWKSKRKEDEDARQFRIDGCKDDLQQALTSLTNSASHLANTALNNLDDEDTTMSDAHPNGTAQEGQEVLTIPLNNLEDELSDIPPEMRATVADEIKAFRDRSNRRDIERMRREEEYENAQSQNQRLNATSTRASRLASPPPSSAPSGPASSANGIPVGPRGAPPAGPKGFRGVQVPSDYVNGVSFVGANGVAVNKEDEDASESDEELERRRNAKQDAEREKMYKDTERRVQNRERTRAAAQERERVREDAAKNSLEREKEQLRSRYSAYDDDDEAAKGRDEYYFDRSSWLRKRTVYRDREARDDERDRKLEERENEDETRKSARARGMADDFLDQMGGEVERRAEAAAATPTEPAPVGGGFKMNLGSAAARTRTAASTQQPKRAMAEVVEGLLEDEEDLAASGLKRPELKPLTETTSLTAPSELSDEERATLRQQLAAEIPTGTEELFAYPVKFNYLTSAIVGERIRPFVEKKVVEYLGVQEDALVEVLLGGLEREKVAGGSGGDGMGPRGLVGELEDALEEEAEVLVRKVWRLVVFWTECESRGLV